jgi:hypothetical protein
VTHPPDITAVSERLRVTGEPEYVRSNFIHGVKRLPVRASAR